MAATLDLVIEQNATFVKSLVWKDAAGVAVDLTGYSARAQIRETIDAAAVLLDLSTVNGRIAIVAATGGITLTVAAADTAAIDWDTGYYDLVLTAPDASRTRLLSGLVSVSKGITE